MHAPENPSHETNLGGKGLISSIMSRNGSLTIIHVDTMGGQNGLVIKN